MVTDYRGHRQTLLPVREINLKACTPVIVKQFILPGLGIEPRPQTRLITVSGSERPVPMSHRDKLLTETLDKPRLPGQVRQQTTASATATDPEAQLYQEQDCISTVLHDHCLCHQPTTLSMSNTVSIVNYNKLQRNTGHAKQQL